MTMTEERSVTQAERDKAHAAGNSLPDKSYPINNVHQLHAAAVLAASHHGDWKAAMTLIRRRAKELGVDVTTLPGFGGESKSAQHDPAWEQRRKRWANSLVGHEERRSLRVQRGNIEVRAKPDGTGGTRFEFRGYAATFGDSFQMWDKWGDPYDEEVVPGAFSSSLKRADLITPFLIGHNEADLPLARTWDTLKLGQDSHGMETFANMNGKRSDVQNLACAVEDNNVDEMSVGFITRGQEWSSDYSKRYMIDMDIHRGDVSVVALAANPATKGVSMVALPTEVLSRQAAEERAAMNQAATTDAPDSDHMTPTVDAHHGPMTTTGHTHGHPTYDTNAAGVASYHDHGHAHNDDNNHHHLHMQAEEGTDATYDPGTPGMTGQDVDRGSARPLERLGNPVDQDMGDGPDYSSDGQVKCVNQMCAHTADYQPPGAKFCSYCGDALVRIGADGMPPMEEEQGAAASLALRRRRLELMALAR